jgi:hypothetical protein
LNYRSPYVRTSILMALLPIEWVEKVPKYAPPKGCVPPLAGQNRREQPGFRSDCSGSAMHLSPIPLGKCKSSSDPDNGNNFRREPMKGRVPHYVLPGAGCTPWASPEFPPPWQRECRPMENRPKSPTRSGEDSY